MTTLVTSVLDLEVNVFFMRLQRIFTVGFVLTIIFIAKQIVSTMGPHFVHLY